jgi:hypothetical protein
MTTLPNLVTIDLDASRDGASPSEVEAIADGLLTALAQSETPATFFVPRTLAESNAPLARRISEAGHELGCLTVSQPTCVKPYCADFGGELKATSAALENATGTRVRGHRNAKFAIDHSSEWVYDMLVDQGFEYDSSRFPPRYTEPGYEPVPRTIHAVRRWGGTLLEVPVSTADVMSVRMQLGTAGSIRGIPMPVWQLLVEDRQMRGDPLVLHLRASELRGTPGLFRRRVDQSADKRTLDRMSGIVRQFSFTSVARALPDLLRSAPTIES